MGIAGDALARSAEVGLADISGDKLERNLARQNLLAAIGDMCSPLLLAASLAAGFGWRGAFVAAGVLLLAYAVLLAAVPIPGPVPHPDGEPRRPLASVAQVAADRRVWALGLLGAVADTFDEPFDAFAIALLIDDRGLAAGAAATAAALATVGGIIGAVVAGRRLPRARSSGIAILAGVALLLAVPGAGGALGLAVVGAATTTLWTRTQATVLRLRPGQAGTTMSVFSVIALVGLVVPPVAGAAADRRGVAGAIGVYLLLAVALAAVTTVLDRLLGGRSQ
jgi:predicted MFS family arabinose efflux permease